MHKWQKFKKNPRATSKTLHISASMLNVKIHDRTIRKTLKKYDLFGSVTRQQKTLLSIRSIAALFKCIWTRLQNRWDQSVDIWIVQIISEIFKDYIILYYVLMHKLLELKEVPFFTWLQYKKKFLLLSDSWHKIKMLSEWTNSTVSGLPGNLALQGKEPKWKM